MVTSLRPWLWLSPQLAHDLGPLALRVLAKFSPVNSPEWRPVQWRHLHFPNPAGVAGGVDKDARQYAAWTALGAGFVEVGTVTPRAQGPNSGKIMDRDTKAKALWNRMGFPSRGLSELVHQLPPRGSNRSPIFINIGKNRDTDNLRASEDYLTLIRGLRDQADAFVINISSPNTKGLRELLDERNLRGFLQPLVKEATSSVGTPIPLLLKLSPDMERVQLEAALLVSSEAGIDGWILTNTTVDRKSGLKFPAEGGVSGKPLAERSKSCLKQAVQVLGSARSGKLLISSGGIFSYSDLQERLDLGADLVQVYSALVFEGPFWFRQLARQARSTT